MLLKRTLTWHNLLHMKLWKCIDTWFKTFHKSECTLWSLQLSNGPVVGSRKRPSEGNYEKEKEHCITLFDQWSEADQVEFVERLISRMCHYQHGHINSYLKPMLQRDFITALPGKDTDTDMNATFSSNCSSAGSILPCLTTHLGMHKSHHQTS